MGREQLTPPPIPTPSEAMSDVTAAGTPRIEFHLLGTKLVTQIRPMVTEGLNVYPTFLLPRKDDFSFFFLPNPPPTNTDTQ